MNPEFLANSKGRMKILVSCSNSKSPNSESEAIKTKSEATMSRRSKVVAMESARITNASIEKKLSGEAQAPTKLVN